MPLQLLGLALSQFMYLVVCFPIRSQQSISKKKLLYRNAKKKCHQFKFVFQVYSIFNSQILIGISLKK